jgi:hypothetical protein
MNAKASVVSVKSLLIRLESGGEVDCSDGVPNPEPDPAAGAGAGVSPTAEVRGTRNRDSYPSQSPQNSQKTHLKAAAWLVRGGKPEQRQATWSEASSVKKLSIENKIGMFVDSRCFPCWYSPYLWRPAQDPRPRLIFNRIHIA